MIKVVKIRRFTDKGLDEFTNYIKELEKPTKINPPTYFKEKPYSEQMRFDVEVDETKHFGSSLDVGRYLHNRIKEKEIKIEEVLGENRMFTWLAYLWIDNFCKKKKDHLKIYEIARYICKSGLWRYYRHSVAGPYYIYSLHGDEESKLFLDSDPHILKDMREQIASRQYIISSKNLVEVANKLYRNKNKDRDKIGSVSKNKGGSARRFSLLINQLRLTYDLRSMEAGEIIELLPDEFEEWID